MDFLENFGANLLTSTANTARTMKSGLAELTGAEMHPKVDKNGVESFSVKVNFDAMSLKEDGIAGYIRSSRANFLFKSLNKYRYMFKGQENAEAIALLNACGNPFEVIKHETQKTEIVNGVEVEVTEDVNGVQVPVMELTPVKIKDVKTDLPALREKYGEDLDFIYLDDTDDYQAVCCFVPDAKGYCERLVVAINELAKSKPVYNLKIVATERNFEDITNITKANI